MSSTLEDKARFAIIHNDVDMMAVVINTGYDLNDFPSLVHKTLLYAPDILKYLIDNNHVNVNRPPGYDGNNLLHKVISYLRDRDFNGKPEPILNLIDLIIKKDIDINEENSKGVSTICAFIEGACVTFGIHDSSIIITYIEKLVAHGADLFMADSDGDDALVYAIIRSEKKHLALVKYLVNKGFDINKKYFFSGGTLLSRIAAGRHWECQEIWKYLLQNGAEVNVLDDRGYTPLMLSIDHRWFFSDELDMAKALLKYGADRSVRAFDGKTFDSIAKERGIDISSLAGLGRY